MVDGVPSEWTPVVSCVLQEILLGPCLFIQYNSWMLDLEENRFFAFGEESTLCATVPVVRELVNWLLYRKQRTDCCSRVVKSLVHVIEPYSKNKALVVSRLKIFHFPL